MIHIIHNIHIYPNQKKFQNCKVKFFNWFAGSNHTSLYFLLFFIVHLSRVLKLWCNLHVLSVEYSFHFFKVLEGILVFLYIYQWNYTSSPFELDHLFSEGFSTLGGLSQSGLALTLSYTPSVNTTFSTFREGNFWVGIKSISFFSKSVTEWRCKNHYMSNK